MILDNNLTIVDIVKENIADRTGIFDEVYEQFIIQFLLDVEEVINCQTGKMGGIEIDAPKIYKSLADVYKESLINVCQKSLIVEINEGKDGLQGETETEQYQYFVTVYMKHNFNRIFNADSELMKLICRKREHLISALKEFWENLSKDILHLNQLIREEIYEISNISIGDGDTHNSGKSVYILTVNENKKIVYKPHSLINDEIYSSIVAFANQQNRLKRKLYHVKVLDRKTYGWQEFVKKESCTCEQEVSDYMYRFGCHVFLCYMLNSTDMHFENIIASKDMPYLIDTETLFTNTYSFGGTRWDQTNNFQRALNNSVFASVLLPINVAGIAGEKQKIDLSGLGGIMGETFVDADVITNKGTSDIGYEHIRVRIDDKLNINNSVLLNGEKINLEPYFKFLLEGFEDCYNLFLESGDRIKEITDNKLLFQGEYRQVLRNTKLYYKYLDASYHPYYLNRKHGRDMVFRKLCGSRLFSQGHAEIIQSECVQMKNGDIPYFYAKYGSRDLFANNQVVVSDFYAKTLKQVFEERLSVLSDQDCKRQIYFIKCAVHSTSSNNKVLRFPLKGQNTFEEVLGYMIENHGISDHDEKIDFYNVVMQDDRYRLGKFSPTLYDGMGMAFCILGMYKASGNRKMLELFRKMSFLMDIPLEEIHSYNKSLGMFDGCGSYLYLSYNLSVLSDEENDKKKFYEYLSFYENVELEDNKNMDIVSGCAGVVLFTAHIIEKNQNNRIQKVCTRFSQRLYQAYCEDALPVRTGFAHGYAGMGTALIKSGKVLDDSRYYKAGVELLKRENTYYVKESHNWIDLRNQKESMAAWCYGTAGILLSRICAYQNSCSEEREMLLEDIQNSYAGLSETAHWMEYDDILCHGTLGNLDILRYYRRNFLQNKEYFPLEDEMEHKLKKYGLKVSNPLDVYNISFMDGISGVLYHELRKKNEEIPCVLLLETF